MSTHHGQCHCGRIAFEVDGEPTRVIETVVAIEMIRKCSGLRLQARI